MAKSKLIAPNEVESIVSPAGIQTRRLGGFFNAIVNAFANQPDQMASISAITTIDATDLTSAIDSANENKAKINEILAGLKSSELMST